MYKITDKLTHYEISNGKETLGPFKTMEDAKEFYKTLDVFRKGRTIDIVCTDKEKREYRILN